MVPRAHSKVTLEQPYFGYFTLKALWAYSLHAIEMRLHGRDASNVIILILETADLLGL